jgi:hypothetical protein
MKIAKVIIAVLVSAIAFSISSDIKAQEKVSVPNLLKEKNFVFIAQTVSPMAGRTRHLTSRYDVRVQADTVAADLPYFGRAYSSTHNMSGGGISFISTDFDYSVVKSKKNKWEIEIRPNDADDVKELFLTVFENGRADLRVNSNSRQAITYSGYLEKK